MQDYGDDLQLDPSEGVGGGQSTQRSVRNIRNIQ